MVGLSARQTVDLTPVASGFGGAGHRFAAATRPAARWNCSSISSARPLAEPASTREIARLAFPALGVLAAEPLYLLFDTAVVGRLGALALVGLAIGALFLGLVSSQGTFLSYGTTARSARHFRALYGTRRGGARRSDRQLAGRGPGGGDQLAVRIAAVPLTMAIAGSADIADAALGWLRIAIGGAPAILLPLAGNGWMRGVQDTRRPLHYVIAGASAVLCPLLVYGYSAAAAGPGRIGRGEPRRPGRRRCSCGRWSANGCRSLRVRGCYAPNW